MAIHGNKSENARVKALQDFKDNRITALVATEVAARPRHQGAAARRELRAAQRAGRLRASHRRYGACRVDGRGDFAGLA
jgi:hypothetical protein